MTWLTTWPTPSGKPKYAEHPSEAAAEAHATEMVRSKQAAVFEIAGDAPETHEVAPEDDAGVVVALGSTGSAEGREIGSQRFEEPA